MCFFAMASISGSLRAERSAVSTAPHALSDFGMMCLKVTHQEVDRISFIEILGHLGMVDGVDKVLANSRCLPCMMPFKRAAHLLSVSGKKSKGMYRGFLTMRILQAVDSVGAPGGN